LFNFISFQINRYLLTKVVGPPKVYPNYGDLSGAWAPGRFHNMEFLEVKYAKAVLITSIHIYETNIVIISFPFFRKKKK